MLKWILQKIVGSKHQRIVKRMWPVVAKINAIEEALQQESHEALLERTAAWQKHLYRYLPMETATKREIEQMDPAQLTELSASLDERFTSLRKEFPDLPAKVEPTPEAIEVAKEALARTAAKLAIDCRLVSRRHAY